MPELGSLLRKARLERGMSLEELQDITKIRIRYLEAIEEEDFSVLPGSFYVRAFIKSYAEAVGMDPDEVVRLYQGILPSVHEELKNESIRPRTRMRIRNVDKIARWASTLIVLSFLVLIAYIIYYFVLKNADPEQHVVNEHPIVENVENNSNLNDPLPVEEEQEIDDEVEPEQETETEPESEPTLTFAATDGSTHIYNLTGASTIELELAMVGGECWVEILKGSSSGEVLAKRIYKQGETETLQIDGSVYVLLGFPRGVDMKINGVEIDSTKLDSKNPVKFQVNLVSS